MSAPDAGAPAESALAAARALFISKRLSEVLNNPIEVGTGIGPVYTIILLLVHPPLSYQFLCIFLSASLVRSLLRSIDPNDRAPLVTF